MCGSVSQESKIKIQAGNINASFSASMSLLENLTDSNFGSIVNPRVNVAASDVDLLRSVRTQSLRT